MASILCIYGTTSGNTELVAEKVSAVLQEARHEVTLQRVERSNISDIDQHNLIILAASTYGHGILQDYFIPFAKELQKTDLSGRKFAVIGLGDTKYDKEYHIESAKILTDIVKKSGGELVCLPLKISKSPLPQLEGKVTQWAKELSGKL